MYSGLNINGGIHHCFTFNERLMTCLRKELMPLKMCGVEGLDFLECI